ACVPLPAPGAPISTMILDIRNFRLAIADWFLDLTLAASGIGNWQSEMPSSPAPAQSSAAAEKTLIIAHHELGLDLRHGIHRHAYQNQQRSAAEVKLVAHSRGNPREAGSGADKRIEPGANQGQAGHFESDQHELREEGDQGEINGADCR